MKTFKNVQAIIVLMLTLGSNLASLQQAKAQWMYEGFPLNAYYLDGNVGIGTNTPSTPLHILQDTLFDQGLRISMPGKSSIISLHLATRGDYGYLHLGGNTKIRGNGKNSSFDGNVGIGTSTPRQRLSINSSRPRIALVDQVGEAGVIEFHEIDNQIRFQYWDQSGGRYQRTMMALDADQNAVGIGTLNIPDDFKLAVNGKVICEEVRVELSESWPDYVFSNEYQLPTLEEVQNHINEKGHLPGIPSAKELSKDGLALGEMQTKMMEKIEELTLYILQQQERIQTLESQLEK